MMIQLAEQIDMVMNLITYSYLRLLLLLEKIPTFKDIEKQIGRKITQDEIDKVLAVDPQIPIQVAQPIEKGMYSPSITNELINTIAGTAGDAVNYLANKAGLHNLAPNEQLVETRDSDALLDLLGYTRQDLVQAALGHDIGKVIDTRQGYHEQISADMIANAMKQNGIIGVQDIKPDVIQAIAKHGLGDQAVDLDPLTKALHVADVTRGANYDQAAIHAGYLFDYPREYPKWNFQRKPLRDELIQNINPVLKRYGYETINPNSTLQEAQQALSSTIDEHRSFVRGVTDTKYEPAQSYMLTNEPTSSKLANGGRRGISGYRDFYGIPKKDTMVYIYLQMQAFLICMVTVVLMARLDL